MNCIRQLTPHVNILFIPPLYPTNVMKSNKKRVRFSNKNDIYLIPPYHNEIIR
jgi:hypothetical protein